MNSQQNSCAAPIRSMTGFATLRRETSAGTLTISLRTVNHRGLDLHFYQAAEMGPFENAMRALLKQRILRGHVEVRTSLIREDRSDSPSFNRQLLRTYLASFRQASAEFNLPGEPDLNTFFRLPGIFEQIPETHALDEKLGAEILQALEECIEQLNRHREQEGCALRRALKPEIEALGKSTREIIGLRDTVLPQLRDKLHARLSELLVTAGISPNRLAEEAAILADKSDIQEELTRLTVHTGELSRIFEDGGEVGKRLDFLLQEMNRETNTILSKSAAAGESGLLVTNLALSMKANIEKIREQSLNFE